MAHHRLARAPKTSKQVGELPIAVGRLVEIHEVHVDRRPGEVSIELRVQVQKRFAQRRAARRSTCAPARKCASMR